MKQARHLCFKVVVPYFGFNSVSSCYLCIPVDAYKLGGDHRKIIAEGLHCPTYESHTYNPVAASTCCCQPSTDMDFPMNQVFVQQDSVDYPSYIFNFWILTLSTFFSQFVDQPRLEMVASSMTRQRKIRLMEPSRTQNVHSSLPDCHHRRA